jgi:hypothetical protein
VPVRVVSTVPGRARRVTAMRWRARHIAPTACLHPAWPRIVSPFIHSVPCFPPRSRAHSLQQQQAERERSSPHTVALLAGVKLRHRTAIPRLRLSQAPPGPLPFRAHALTLVFTMVRPGQAFPFHGGAMATELGPPWLELPSSPSLHFSLILHSLGARGPYACRTFLR